MKIYRVGGAVRDKLLGLCAHDTDYVVVGSSPEEMLRLGFKEVGRGFPVFLDPNTREEYALARKEIKTGLKHTDFRFIFDPHVTLEEDLRRRDFTCNALAEDIETGEITDCFNGKKDIKNRILRHIDSTHFPEDPLRILRLCRFAGQLDFEPAPETMDLCRKMVSDGLLTHLSAERFWTEISKALQTAHFDRFIETMRQIGALRVLLPEVDSLWKDERGPRLTDCLKKAQKASESLKFALLFALTDHPEQTIPTLYKRIRTPKRIEYIAKIMCQNVPLWAKISPQNPEQTFDIAQTLEAKSYDLTEDFILMMRLLSADSDFETRANFLRRVVSEEKKISLSDMPNFNDLNRLPDPSAEIRRYKIRILKQTLF